MLKKVISTAILAVLVAAYAAIAATLWMQSVQHGSLAGAVFFGFLATFGSYMTVALPALHWQTYK